MTVKAGPARTWYSVPDPRYAHTHSESNEQLQEREGQTNSTSTCFMSVLIYFKGGTKLCSLLSEVCTC